MSSQSRLDAVELVAGHQGRRPGRWRAPAGGHSSGSASTQPPDHGLVPSRRSSGTASSTRSAARSTSPAASACRTAGSGSPASSYQSLARRCSSGESSGRSASRCAAGRRRTGGGSGTSVAGRRAGPGTGCGGPATRASARSPVAPVTASHSGPVSRSRIAVSSRKLRTLVGLPVEDLLDEVVDDVPVVAGEPGDERATGRRGPQRQRGQLQRGDPALGPGAPARRRRPRPGRDRSRREVGAPSPRR